MKIYDPQEDIKKIKVQQGQGIHNKEIEVGVRGRFTLIRNTKTKTSVRLMKITQITSSMKENLILIIAHQENNKKPQE